MTNENSVDAKAPSEQVGTELLFENDRVRVWDLRLAPGDRAGFHRHSHDYFFVVIGGGKLKSVRGDGSDWYETEMADGEVHFREIESEDVHDAINVGEKAWRNIVVELKR
jgi:quercetin dioxygenase-like cupin family protein